MEFTEALTAAFKSDARITRTSWTSRDLYGEVRDGTLQIKHTDGKFHLWIVHEADFFADDWTVLEES